MKKKEQRKRIGTRSLVTVCWLDREVSLVIWEPRHGSGRVSRLAERIAAEDCTPEGYREAILRLAGRARARRLRVRWVLLKEAFPPLPEGDPDGPVRLPDWMGRCWSGLGARELPDEVVSGTGAMEEELLAWPAFSADGTGFYAGLGGRAIFIGHGNGRSYRRVSRQDLAPEEGAGVLNSEWLLQTRVLYRNRTAIDVKRVYMPEGTEFALSWEGEAPFEIRPGWKPGAWRPRRGLELDSALNFLHCSAARQRLEPRSLLSFPFIERRRRLRDWDRRLRVGAGLLLCGWGFLMLGACRHETGPGEAGHAAVPAWRDARDSLAAMEASWRHWRKDIDARQLPLVLVGAVADSIPEGVQLSRIHLEPEDSGTLALEMAGTFDGQQPSSVFRRWMDDLRVKSPLRHVENLHLERKDNRIAFTLHGRTRKGENSK